MRKNAFHYAVSALFLLIIIGIRVAQRVTSPDAINNPGHSLVKLKLPSTLDSTRFTAVKEGMGFDQMLTALNLNDVGDDVRSVANDPHALVVLLNQDGTSFEFMFNQGQVGEKHMYDMKTTRFHEVQRAGEQYQTVH